jgi:glycosyltransferase involved in cell wall biosynthesis
MAETHSSKVLVVSAVNLVEGGTLTVLQHFLAHARRALDSEWRIVALVNRASVVAVEGVEPLAFPHVKTRWLNRVWFEYWQCQALSRRLNADLWVALHDMTPRVQARRQAVYCHNPSPFYRITLREAWLDPKLLAFKWLYGWLYRINLRRNDAVIVQQEWLRREFRRRYRASNVVVAHPVDAECSAGGRPIDRARPVFLYPALARPFKNFELVCEAVRRLEARQVWRGELRLTVDGSENAYARALVRRYGASKGIRFIGLQDADGMRTHYSQAHCLVFPSRRETWGLPLTEAKALGLDILAADLPYARESIGRYGRADFFNVDDAEQLAGKLLAVCDGTLRFAGQHPAPPAEPYAPDWAALVRLLTKGL